nr:unnamed protein product [Digitaria exilis]
MELGGAYSPIGFRGELDRIRFRCRCRSRPDEVASLLPEASSQRTAETRNQEE